MLIKNTINIGERNMRQLEKIGNIVDQWLNLGFDLCLFAPTFVCGYLEQMFSKHITRK